MIIACPCGKKNFEIDQKFIPLEGRMLQCGSCDRQWFFKFKDETKINKEKTLKEDNAREEFIKEETIPEKKVDLNIEEINLTEEKTEVKNKNNINYFNIIRGSKHIRNFLILLISTKPNLTCLAFNNIFSFI